MSAMKKMKNNTGASMMLVLALLLVCVMVSSVIVSTAASGSSRNTRRVEQQRDYLAVSSGAQFVAENMQNIGTFVGSTEINTKPCYAYRNNAGSVETVSGDFVSGYWVPISPIPDTTEFYIVGELCESTIVPKMDDATSFQGTFANLMKAAASEVYLKNTSYEEIFYITIPDETQRLPKVKCVFTMNQNYNVKVVVTSESGNSDYSIVVTMNTTNPVVPTDDGSKQTITCTHPVCYKVLQNGTWVIMEETRTFSHEVSGPVTTVTWKKPVLTKGVD